MYEMPQSLLVADPINRYLINSPMLPQCSAMPMAGLLALDALASFNGTVCGVERTCELNRMPSRRG